MKAMNSFVKKEVALLGANSIFGRVTSFLLKQSPTLNKLTLYDNDEIKISDDIQYINTPCKVSFVNGQESMSEAIKTADIIIIGDDCVKELTYETVFLSRAPIIANYVKQMACHNSNAIVVVATTPVNMTVPLVAETLKNLSKWNKKKLVGLTNVENMRARCILASYLQISPRTIVFPVIGGSSSETRVPLLSKIHPYIQLNESNLQKITCAVKTSEIKFHNASGSQEKLNRAYATSMLIQSIVAALNGHKVVETVLSYQNVIDNTNYFSLPVILREDGIKKHITFPSISLHEKYLVSYAIRCMASDVKKAKDYSDKIKDNLIKIIPKNKFKDSKLPIEENSKIIMHHLQCNPANNVINNTTEPINSEPIKKLPKLGKQHVTTMNEVNVAHNLKVNDNFDRLTSKSVENRSVKSEDKLPVCINEDIASEIDVTPGINSIPSKSDCLFISKNVTKSLQEEITSEKSFVNFQDSRANGFKTDAAKITQQFTVTHSDSKAKENVFQDQQMYINSKDIKKPCVIIEDIDNKTPQKDVDSALSVISLLVSLLTENLQTKNSSELKKKTFNSGLENCKSLKRYHREVSNFRKDFSNTNRDDIDNKNLNKEIMDLDHFEVPNNEDITVISSENKDLYSIKNYIKSEPIEEIFDNERSKVKKKSIGQLRKLPPAKYLTSFHGKPSKFSFLPKKKTVPMLDASHQKLYPKILNHIFPLGTVMCNNIGRKFNLREEIISLKKIYECLDFQVKAHRVIDKEAYKIPIKNKQGFYNNSYWNVEPGRKNSLKINKPLLMLQSGLFKSYKYQSSKSPVTEWSRYASSESHKKQIDNNETNNDNYYHHPKQNCSIKNSVKDIDSKYVLKSNICEQKNKTKHQPENTPQQSEASQVTVKKSNFSDRSNLHQHKLCNMYTIKSNDDSFFESLMSKQKSTISSGLKHSYFRIQEDSFPVPQRSANYWPKSVGKNIENLKNNQQELRKLHLLKTNSASNQRISKTVSKSEQQTTRMNDDTWKKKYFKKVNNKGTTLSAPVKASTIEANLQNTSKIVENIGYHFPKGEKDSSTNMRGYKERVEKNKCNHNSKIDAVKNEDTLNTSKSDFNTSKPFMNIQKKAMADLWEVKSENKMLPVNDHYTCKSLTDVSCDIRSQEPRINLGYLLKHPSMNSKTNVVNTESAENVKNIKNSIEIHSFKESENDAVEN